MSKFDLDNEIDKLVCPNMLKAGLKFYIQTNKIKITSKKEFDKVVADYEKSNIGG